jgi:hypothetical protein
MNISDIIENDTALINYIYENAVGIKVKELTLNQTLTEYELRRIQTVIDKIHFNNNEKFIDIRYVIICDIEVKQGKKYDRIKKIANYK